MTRERYRRTPAPKRKVVPVNVDLEPILLEAKRELEAQLAAERAARKPGRPRKGIKVGSKYDFND